MNAELIFVIEDAPEGGFTARALGESIFTQADSFRELKEMVRDAVLCHYEPGQHPRIIRLHYVKDEVFTL